VIGVAMAEVGISFDVERGEISSADELSNNAPLVVIGIDAAVEEIGSPSDVEIAQLYVVAKRRVIDDKCSLSLIPVEVGSGSVNVWNKVLDSAEIDVKIDEVLPSPALIEVPTVPDVSCTTSEV
jgi:hypothetical protein